MGYNCKYTQYFFVMGNDMDRETEIKKIINCRNCGAEFEASLPNCPYCGRMNLPAAESEYMTKLENIRGDLEELGGMAGRKAIVHSRRMSRKLLTVLAAMFLIAAVIVAVRAVQSRENAGKSREEYLWQRVAFEQMDELYNARDFDALAEAYSAARDEGHSVYQYKHSGFCGYLLEIEWALAELSEFDKDSGSAVSLFSDEINLYALDYDKNLSDEERTLLEGMRMPIKEDFEQRFGLSDEELAYFMDFLRKDGFVPFAECERFIKGRSMAG